MPAADLLLSFFLASAVFAFTPGPGLLYAAAQTVALGRRAGWWSALGFHIAGFWHIAAAAAGFSALLAVTPALFLVMKLIGAAYLIWMGVRYLRQPGPVPSTTAAAAAPTAVPLNTRGALRDSIVVELTNPKSALFFLAFLPQFADPSADWPVWAQIIVLGVFVNCLFSLAELLVIETTHAVAARAQLKQQGRKPAGRKIGWLQKIGGGVLIALGVNLAFARPP